MESSARFVALLLLCHRLAPELSENRDRLFAAPRRFFLPPKF